ncbi:glycosyltransferase family 2 protein [Halobellus limi]|uniref:Glycosyltransferase family 2 protein n=1 Tax=Halobellus limi TaxID=699433 RepID=A0A1H5TXG0_9EURY|nr:glycosyltransferase family 2 protein [Halobellus limi]QCC47210.1 glycosyltransferase family 2 protein [Halobellus limi]SEF67486.1 Glycosyltransferase involved in cell wall bisynthesis [Halobellus limi]
MISRISVIIPTFRRNESLEGALESVKNQTVSEENVEIFVVDGADGNAQHIAEDFGATYLSPTPDPGIAGCRQLGIDEADGKYIHFLDDDDTLTESAIESQVEAAEETGAEVVYGAIQWPDGRILQPNPEVQEDVLPQALAFEMAPCIPSTMLISAEALKRIPRMETLPSDDIAVNIELAQFAEYKFVNEVVAKRQPGEAGVGGEKEIVENRRKTITEYRDLYQEHPEAYRRATAATNLLAAQAEFRDHIWSLRAIWYGLCAAQNSPSIATTGYAIAAFFGRPGRDMARQIYSKYILDETNEGKIW